MSSRALANSTPGGSDHGRHCCFGADFELDRARLWSLALRVEPGAPASIAPDRADRRARAAAPAPQPPAMGAGATRLRVVGEAVVPPFDAALPRLFLVVP